MLDQPIDLPVAPARIQYGGFWLRLGALILDTIILLPITLGLTYFNITSWKNIEVFFLISIVGTAYKPLLEYWYGATLGKMAMGIKVVNLQFQKANGQEILLRNIFQIVLTTISVLLSIEMYTSPDLEEVRGFMDYITFSSKFTTLALFSNITSLVYIADVIVLLADDRKRSLHDRIAKTFVIEKGSALG